jgi:hypothetical protein
MDAKTIETGRAPRVIVRAHEAMRIEAHDMGELRVDGDTSVRTTGGRYEIEAQSRCTVLIPHDSDLTVEFASRSIEIVGVMGEIRVENVEQRGDLTLRNIGPVQIENANRNVFAHAVHGDFKAEDIGGNLELSGLMGAGHFDSIGGNATATDADGDLRFDDVGGNLTVERARGDISVEDVGGNLTIAGPSQSIEIGDVGGNATLQGVNCPVRIGDVGGSLVVRGATELSVSDVGGDCRVSGVLRAAELDVGGSFDGREAVLAGGAAIDVGGNAWLTIDPRDGEEYSVDAGGNIWCQLSDGAQADVTIEDYSGRRKFTLGDGGADVRLETGGKAELSGAANVDVRREAFDNGRKMGKFKVKLPNIPMPRKFPGMGDIGNLGDYISGAVERAMREANIALSQAQNDIQSGFERAARDAQAAAGDQQERGERGAPGWAGERDGEHPAETTAAASSPGVTDEEQKVILRMLADKKITVEQADQLLAALQGGLA